MTFALRTTTPASPRLTDTVTLPPLNSAPEQLSVSTSTLYAPVVASGVIVTAGGVHVTLDPVFWKVNTADTAPVTPVSVPATVNAVRGGPPGTPSRALAMRLPTNAAAITTTASTAAFAAKRPQSSRSLLIARLPESRLRT
ncbi:MAG: hypothetical protein U0324_34360 [Polyangiales bacterium]